MTRRLACRVAVVLSVAVLLAGCTAADETPPRASAAAPERIERLRVAAGPGGYPSPIGPRLTAMLQASLLFDALVWKDSTGGVIPWLARAWERSSDGTKWTFMLRDGIQWHDGAPLTADDVVFTFDYLIRGPGRAPAGIFGQVFISNFVGVSTANGNQVIFQLQRPWATFLEGIAGLVRILPKHVWEGISDPARFTGPQAVMGSGPYRLESFDQATNAAAFVANERFFLGAPKVQRIEFVPVADELQALERDDIDVANVGTEDQLPERALAPFETDRFAAVVGQQEWNRALHFNLTRGFPYNDTRFRQAVAYAVDRADMVRRILFGRGVPGSAGSLAPSSPWAAPNLPAYNHDPGRARALLDEVGLRDANGDGRRDLPDGSPFVPVLRTSAQLSTKTAELISEYLRDVGLAITIQTMEAVAADEAMRNGDYDLALIGYFGLSNDPDILIRIRFSPAAVNLPYKAHGFRNARLETLGVEQLFSADDAQRKAIVHEMQRIVAEELPLISLYVPTQRVLYRTGGFDAWYSTPGGFGGGVISGVLNKHALVTGKKAGF